MQKLLSLIPRLMLLLTLATPTSAFAREYRDDRMRFTIPDDYPYSAFEDSEQGLWGFRTEKDNVKITLFRFSTKKGIDRSNCLSHLDTQWLPSLAKLGVIETSKPLWKRYDKVSDYRSTHGYVRIYRYIDHKGLGFLIAESPQPEWDNAEQIASSQRYEITVRYLFDRASYLFITLLGSLLLGGVLIYTGYVILQNAGNYRLWLGLLLIGSIGGLLIYFQPFLTRQIWMIITGIALGWMVFKFSDSDSDSPDDNSPCDGYDGRGTTINHDF